MDLEPHKVREVWMSATASPNHWVDIEAVIERKIEALRLHASQLGEFPLHEFVPEMARGSAEGGPYKMAESFRRMVLE